MFLEHPADGQGDCYTCGARAQVTLCDVTGRVRRGCISVTVVDHGVVGLINELPKDGVHWRRRNDDHAVRYGQVHGDEGAHSHVPWDELARVRMDRRPDDCLRSLQLFDFLHRHVDFPLSSLLETFFLS